MITNNGEKIKYIGWEIMFMAIIAWMWLFSGRSLIKSEDRNSALVLTDNSPEDEVSAKLTMFIEFVNQNKSNNTGLNKQYVNKGLIYLSGVLSAIIKNHYNDNTVLNNQKDELLKINQKILNDDSLSAENLRKSLLLSSKIIYRIQSNEFPDLDKASKDLENSAMEIEEDESFEILKFRTADYFEKSSNIFIAMAIIKARRNNEVRDGFYQIRST